MPNRLTNETSPYLLQHANNPVDWHPWGDEALGLAKKEGKPILVSIGYAACHWCHVMEHESFEDETVAAFMNEHFVNIKIDREERPDLDAIYMDAVVAVNNGGGGWPLNCFLMPDGRPFFGGTYFPPRPMHQRPDWLSVLKWVANQFATARPEMEEQANRLTRHIFTHEKNTFESSLTPGQAAEPIPTGLVRQAFDRLKAAADLHEGGFGGAPKFPSSMAVDFLMKYHYHTGDGKALTHALFSLKKMMRGGIYDHLGGGFARYTVDGEWLVPHFEKMLYDNALLTVNYANAYAITQNPAFLQTMEQTISWVLRDMQSPQGGFYSSFDADSEGEEGKFYIWSKDEVTGLLPKGDADIFMRYYDITDHGNWEGHNILNIGLPEDAFAKAGGMALGELEELLARCRKILFDRREQRPKPGLDDKIILSWNALMVSGLARAAAVSGKAAYRKAATRCLDFLMGTFTANDPNRPASALHHTCNKGGKARFFGFLDDYALLIAALLDVYQLTFDLKLLQKAEAYLQYVLNHFNDGQNALFFYTDRVQTDLLGRKKEYYDNATPSGNSTMADNLHRLGLLLGKEEYVERALKMTKTIEGLLTRHPLAFGRWLGVWQGLARNMREVSIVGKDAPGLAERANALFLPDVVMAAAENDASATLPMLENRTAADGSTLIYVCQNRACQLPTGSLPGFMAQIGYPDYGSYKYNA